MSHFSSPESRKALINALVDFYRISFAEAERFVDSNPVFSWIVRAIDESRARQKEEHTFLKQSVDLERDLHYAEMDERVALRTKEILDAQQSNRKG